MYEKDLVIQQERDNLVAEENKNKRLQKDNDRLNEELNNLLKFKNSSKDMEMQLSMLNIKMQNDQQKYKKETEDLKQYYDKLLKEGDKNKNDYYQKRISELELMVNELENENNNLKQNHNKTIIEHKHSHDSETNKLREQHKSTQIEFENNLQKEKGSHKNTIIEKDSHVSKLNQCNNTIINLEEEIKFLKLSNEKNVKILEAEIYEQKNLNKNFGGNLQDEKKKIYSNHKRKFGIQGTEKFISPKKCRIRGNY